jgi:hypothetical protein
MRLAHELWWLGRKVQKDGIKGIEGEREREREKMKLAHELW